MKDVQRANKEDLFDSLQQFFSEILVVGGFLESEERE
jgi:hypothetical protein